MDWIVSKTLRPRRTFQIDAFGVPQLQLGDIVTIDCDLPDGAKLVDTDQQFSVFEISQARDSGNLSTTLRVVEV